MDKRVMLLIGLAVLAVGSLLYGILTPSKARREPGSALDFESGTAVPAETAAASLVPAERKMARTSYPRWGRNPFRGEETVREAVYGGSLLLNGIAWDEKNPKAIINDRIVGVGDEIAGNRVVAVEKHKVVVNDGVSDFELRLGRGRSS